MMTKMIAIPMTLALLAACSGQPAANNAGGTMGQSTADTLDSYEQQQRAYLQGLTPVQGWTATPTGLRYRRIAGNGQGRHPTLAETVNITYSGKLTDGTEFDATPPNEPIDLPLGRLIPGWKEGIPLMSVGDTYEFAIPSGMGYGPEGSGPIPGGATLLFTVKLFAIR